MCYVLDNVCLLTDCHKFCRMWRLSSIAKNPNSKAKESEELNKRRGNIWQEKCPTKSVHLDEHIVDGWLPITLRNTFRFCHSFLLKLLPQSFLFFVCSNISKMFGRFQIARHSTAVCFSTLSGLGSYFLRNLRTIVTFHIHNSPAAGLFGFCMYSYLFIICYSFVSPFFSLRIKKIKNAGESWVKGAS